MTDSDEQGRSDYAGISSSDSVARVLVVDDHGLVRAGLRELIDAEPDLKTCTEAANLAEAKLAVERYSPQVVLLDLTLGIEDGRELLRWLATRPNPPSVLILSMEEEAMWAADLLAMGARGYLQKASTPTQILAAVRLVLAGKIALSPALTQSLVRRMSKGRDATFGAGPTGVTGADALTPRERQILGLVAQARSSRDIAQTLGCAMKTVDTHKRAICEKLALNGSADLLRYAVTYRRLVGDR